MGLLYLSATVSKFHACLNFSPRHELAQHLLALSSLKPLIHSESWWGSNNSNYGRAIHHFNRVSNCMSLMIFLFSSVNFPTVTQRVFPSSDVRCCVVYGSPLSFTTRYKRNTVIMHLSEGGGCHSVEVGERETERERERERGSGIVCVNSSNSCRN